MSDLASGDLMPEMCNLWLSDLKNNRAGLTVRVTECHVSERGPFQKIEVFQTPGFGKLLVLIGVIMHSERETSYQEMLTHPALLRHPKPEKVLILGGGDGGALIETLKHPAVRAVTVVEIDGRVVDICRKQFDGVERAFADPRVTLKLADGHEFLRTLQDRFDVILVDSYNPMGPSESLLGSSFFAETARCLAEEGVLATQIESPVYKLPEIRRTLKELSKRFKIARLYLAHVRLYPAGNWAFAYASNTLDPLKDFRPDLKKIEALRTKYYNEEIHGAAFALPNEIRRGLL